MSMTGPTGTAPTFTAKEEALFGKLYVGWMKDKVTIEQIAEKLKGHFPRFKEYSQARQAINTEGRRKLEEKLNSENAKDRSSIDELQETNVLLMQKAREIEARRQASRDTAVSNIMGGVASLKLT